ncbi:hypothetical protein CDO52_10820 [Nocardiopsis gilva YIM 90087]|uniref:Uncharacterized protein n=1 Tax=Nocardiopsis gilva YIM 90087 TaxID=1235441 RepID=A0A223S4Y4_9ACTN|nr:hypothetical protein [Nocardiopsis gilva]ASU83202.1 hypothetical protein CDO52_10820 [Nocardiopsis gilva YIM 90087]
MSLAFYTVRFDIPVTTSTDNWVKEERFDFSKRIRWDDHHHACVDVALKSFDLQYLTDGRVYEYLLGRENIRLDLDPGRGHGDGSVTLTVQLRPMAPQARLDIGFKGYVEALVIADLWDE